MPLLTAAPVAKHFEVVHEIVRTDDVATGMDIGSHVAPPSWVTTPFAGALGSDEPRALGPTATQSTSLVHETELRVVKPSDKVAGVHVAPASLVTKIESPTAMQ
ncbi:MAG: hypothetical protein WCG96_10100, partial [Actinomycetes bacterium]